MYRAFVAGQRHDLAHSLKPIQEIVDARLDAQHSFAAMRCNEFCFRNAKLSGQIALAHFRVLGSRNANLMRRGFYALIHFQIPSC